MSTDVSGSGTSAPIHPAAGTVSISKWVNEKLPAWSEILTAHDVARLTRRPPWCLSALSLLGRFPKPQRFHGQAIGWARRDVMNWMSRTSTAHRRKGRPRPQFEAHATPQRLLPLHYWRVCKQPHRRKGCATRRKGDVR